MKNELLDFKSVFGLGFVQVLNISIFLLLKTECYYSVVVGQLRKNNVSMHGTAVIAFFCKSVCNNKTETEPLLGFPLISGFPFAAVVARRSDIFSR